MDDGVNGYTFKTSDELSKHIVNWFDGFPDKEIAQAMRMELSKFQKSRWEDNWTLRVKSIFDY